MASHLMDVAVHVVLEEINSVPLALNLRFCISVTLMLMSFLKILSGCLAVGAEHAFDEQPFYYAVHGTVVREPIRQQDFQAPISPSNSEIHFFNPFECQLILGYLVIFI